MIRASSLSGDTLITCHYPVVQLPSWQLPVQALCSAAERPGRLCARGVTRAVSLPEQDTLHRGPALACNRQRASSGSLKEERAEEEAVSDSSGRYDSSSSLEDALQRAGSGRTKECPAARGGLRSRNPFLPSADLEEDEEDEDSDGDNLHKYREDSSFVLHGNFNWALRNVPRNPKVPIADAGGVRGGEPSVLDVESDRESLSNQPNSLDPPPTEFQILDVRESGGCGQDPARRKSNMPCFTFGQPKCPESVNTGHRESVSDSSCNSSDGILVNFCTIYNKSNNPATPHDNLGSPAPRPQPPDEGSVFLNLRPVPRSPGRDPRRGTRTVSPPLEEETKATPSAPRWSPRGLDSNCNLYPLEPASRGPSSPEVSDLTACLQSPVTLTTGTNQKYYKLVTCDPPSQSPSPAWSGLGSRPEGQRRSGLVPPSESFSLGKGKEGHRKDEKEKETQQTDGAGSFPLQSTGGFDCTKRGGYNPPAYTEKPLCETVPTDYVRRCSDAPVRLSRSSTRSNLSQGGRGVSAHPPAILEHCETGAEDEGACSWATPVVRYSKAQRPTSLPIQPFVLLPPGNPKTQHLGTLLDQYISHKSSKPSSSQPVSKCKGEGDRLPTRLQPSPMGNFGPILLEAPSSSDTCSTCTPSPECFSHSRTWSHSSAGNRHTSLCTSQSSINLTHASPQPNAVQLQDNTSPYAGPTQDKNVLNLNSNSPGSLIPPQNQSSLGKVPTCHDLISLTPEQTRATTGTGRESPTPPQTQSTFPPAPPALPGASQTQPGHLLMPLSPNPASEPKDEWRRRPPTPAAEPASFYGGLSAALSTVAPLSSLSSLLSLARSKACPRQGTAGPGEEQSRSRRCDSLMLSDRPPTELCLSPDASYESMSISHLQRRGLLRSVSGAVDLIMAHFGSSRDHEEKMRLGNSSRSPTIVGLVLEHLCPTIQNILEDGLRDHKLDLIIGQRRNHSWSVVEVSSQIGRSSRVLHNLVSKIRQCPQLSSHCMRLRAFIMGLLNLRSLEFWLSNLQSQKDVVAVYYHSWGFLSVSQSRCQPLFQELLLLLQPLSAVPFDLNLLLEPRLLQSGRLISADDQCSPPPPSACYTLLMSSWPQLQAERHAGAGSSSKQTGPVAAPKSTSNGTSRAEVANGGPWSGWQIRQPLPVYGVAEGGRCGRKPRSRRGVGGGGPQEAAGGRETPPPGEQPSPRVRDGSPSRGGLRWARLFGAAGVPSAGTPPASPSPGGAQPRRCRHPSRWLRLDGARLGRLARSAMSAKLGGGGEAEQAFA